MRMDGEDVYGRKISTRYARTAVPSTYSSDEGYSTAPASYQQPSFIPPPPQVCTIHTYTHKFSCLFHEAPGTQLTFVCGQSRTI